MNGFYLSAKLIKFRDILPIIYGCNWKGMINFVKGMSPMKNLIVHIFALLAMMLSLPVETSGALQCRRYDFAATSQALQSHISNAQQDPAGFLWFATWNGLVRFDGYNFHTFHPVALSDGSIVSNRIYSLIVGSTGNIWCLSSDNHVFYFDHAGMKFIDIQGLIPEIEGLKTRTMTVLRNGCLWVMFRDDAAIRMSDVDPLSCHTFYRAGEGILAGAKEIRSVSHTELGEEWIITDVAAVNLSSGKSVKGQFRNVVSAGGMNVALTSDGKAVILNRNLGKVGEEELFEGDNVKVSFCTTVNDRIFVASNRGLSALDARTGVVTIFPVGGVVSLFQDSRHRLWCFGDKGELWLVEPGSRGEIAALTGQAERLEKPLKHPQLIYENKSGRVIVRTAGSPLSVYNDDTRSLEEIRMTGSVPEGPTPDIKKYMADNADNLWIFYDRGADCLTFSEDYFSHAVNPSRTETRAMLVDSKGRQWITDRSNTVEIKDGPQTLYLGRDGRLSSAPSGFAGSSIYTVREDAEGSVWMGTKGEGLYRLTPTDQHARAFRIQHFSCEIPGSTLPSDTIYDMVTHRGEVWLGSYGGGLSRGRKDADGNYSFSYVKGQPQGMKVRGLMIDEPSETLMVATTDGLVTVDISATEPKFYVNRFRPEPWGLKGNDVMEIIRTDDRYYVCVFGVGVSRIVSDDLLSDSVHFETYPLPMGAAATQIRTAVPSGNDIWIMSERTVSRFSTRTGLYATRFIGTASDRYSLSEADPIFADGYITAGTSDGVVTFRPADLIAEGVMAPVPIVTGIQYQNDLEIHPLNDLSTLNISPDQRTFTLFLSSMTFDTSDREGEGPQFRYMLDNYDKGWNYTAAVRPSVNYSNVSPGRYTLRIETLNPDGSWSDARRIEVNVDARFTETLLFRFMIVFIVLALLFGMTIAAFRFKRMRNEIQQKYSLLMSVDNISSSLTPDRLAARQAETREDKDRKFLDDSAAFIAANIDNPDLVVEDLARNSGMSRTAYYTRLKQITGLTPVDFIKQMRIKKALELLQGGKLSVTEVAYGVGFTDPKYFSRCFKAEMDLTPTQYIESRRKASDADVTE